MSSYQRMKRVCPLRPHVKKGRDPLPLSQPQFAGLPGWILLTHNADGDPDALFVDQQDRVTPLSIVMDERLFSDTVFRAVQLSQSVYVVSDIRFLNGINLFETLSFADRKTKLADLLDAFHVPDLVALMLPDDVPSTTPVRGLETYDDKPGTVGVFLPAME